jgi:phosphotransferase system  glucose/maltose/N-acetylglucosamine-specific IIC component
MKNWKTTSAGISMITGAIVGVYFAIQANEVNEVVITAAITAILGGIGLIVSKDGVS